MFNEEQREHMASLASIPPGDRCWCGWGVAGRCDTPSPCPSDATLSEKIASRLPCCGRAPDYITSTRTTSSHYAGCTLEHREWERSTVDLGGEAG